MKKLLIILTLFALIVGACGPKPMYKTRSGKKKLKHYNSIQYGGEKR